MKDETWVVIMKQEKILKKAYSSSTIDIAPSAKIDREAGRHGDLWPSTHAESHVKTRLKLRILFDYPVRLLRSFFPFINIYKNRRL